MSNLTSPAVNFAFENDNVQVSTPTLGVSHVLARTTKGPFNDPSTLITNLGQFQSLFGSEIVPDGSVSNIETALNLGSKLRVCRVPGTGTAQGVASNATLTSGLWVANATPVNTLTLEVDGAGLSDPVSIVLNIKTKECGTSLGGTNNNFLLKFSQTANLVTANLYNTNVNSNLDNTTLLESKAFIKYINGSSTVNSFIDTSILKSYIEGNKYLEITFKSSTDTTITSIDDSINFLKLHQGTSDGIFSVGDGTAEVSGGVTPVSVVYVGTEGNAGSVPTAAQWISALEFLKDYSAETYQLGCSHINQHLTSGTDVQSVHIALAKYAMDSQEFVYYIDIPKYNSSGDAMSYSELASWVQTMISVVGYSQFVAYFGGGLKYYNSSASLKSCDNLGTVLGLGDSSASNYGPWYHFSGVNRGLVTTARGLVSPNYGVPTKKTEINYLASNYVNIFVIKDTPSSGKQVMLWHNFTTQLLDNSNKFLGITRLNLYIKKTLRPILESYIEEPNTFSTWDAIYRKVKPKLDDLIDGKAMTEYTWYGDQDAKAYSDLQVNNEADVRNGKYKAKLRYKEVIALQEINMDIIIDATTGTVTIDQTT